MSQNSDNLASFIWSLADLLRGDFKQSQYGRVILPFTLLRRLECILEPTKAEFLAKAEGTLAQDMPEEARERILLSKANNCFYNTSRMDLSKLG